jgi:hypothetical protein
VSVKFGFYSICGLYEISLCFDVYNCVCRSKSYLTELEHVLSVHEQETS